MEDWELDFHWLKIRHKIKEDFGKSKLPNLNAILLLIGIQELGKVQEKFTKEDKQDLMHIAVCHLLSKDGYYEFTGLDQDGWPHWNRVRPIREEGVKAQEKLLKVKIIEYFREFYEEEE